MENDTRELLLMAVRVFNEVETGIRARCYRVRDGASFCCVIYVVVFLFFFRVLIPALPAICASKAYYGAGCVFFLGLPVFGLVEYSVPKMIEISYLFRKEAFLHRVIDRYGLPVAKPTLTHQPVETRLFFRWGRMRLSNPAVAAMFAPAVWLFARQDPMQELEARYAIPVS